MSRETKIAELEARLSFIRRTRELTGEVNAGEEELQLIRSLEELRDEEFVEIYEEHAAYRFEKEKRDAKGVLQERLEELTKKLNEMEESRASLKDTLGSYQSKLNNEYYIPSDEEIAQEVREGMVPLAPLAPELQEIKPREYKTILEDMAQNVGRFTHSANVLMPQEESVRSSLLSDYDWTSPASLQEAKDRLVDVLVKHGGNKDMLARAKSNSLFAELVRSLVPSVEDQFAKDFESSKKARDAKEAAEESKRTTTESMMDQVVDLLQILIEGSSKAESEMSQLRQNPLQELAIPSERYDMWTDYDLTPVQKEVLYPLLLDRDKQVVAQEYRLGLRRLRTKDDLTEGERKYVAEEELDKLMDRKFMKPESRTLWEEMFLMGQADEGRFRRADQLMKQEAEQYAQDKVSQEIVLLDSRGQILDSHILDLQDEVSSIERLRGSRELIARAKEKTQIAERRELQKIADDFYPGVLKDYAESSPPEYSRLAHSLFLMEKARQRGERSDINGKDYKVRYKFDATYATPLRNAILTSNKNLPEGIETELQPRLADMFNNPMHPKELLDIWKGVVKDNDEKDRWGFGPLAKSYNEKSLEKDYYRIAGYGYERMMGRVPPADYGQALLLFTDFPFYHSGPARPVPITNHLPLNLATLNQPLNYLSRSATDNRPAAYWDGDRAFNSVNHTLMALRDYNYQLRRAMRILKDEKKSRDSFPYLTEEEREKFKKLPESIFDSESWPEYPARSMPTLVDMGPNEDTFIVFPRTLFRGRMNPPQLYYNREKVPGEGEEDLPAAPQREGGIFYFHKDREYGEDILRRRYSFGNLEEKDEKELKRLNDIIASGGITPELDEEKKQLEQKMHLLQRQKDEMEYPSVSDFQDFMDHPYQDLVFKSLLKKISVIHPRFLNGYEYHLRRALRAFQRLDFSGLNETFLALNNVLKKSEAEEKPGKKEEKGRTGAEVDLKSIAPPTEEERATAGAPLDTEDEEEESNLAEIPDSSDELQERSLEQEMAELYSSPEMAQAMNMDAREIQEAAISQRREKYLFQESIFTNPFTGVYSLLEKIEDPNEQKIVNAKMTTTVIGSILQNNPNFREIKSHYLPRPYQPLLQKDWDTIDELTPRVKEVDFSDADRERLEDATSNVEKMYNKEQGFDVFYHHGEDRDIEYPLSYIDQEELPPHRSWEPGYDTEGGTRARIYYPRSRHIPRGNQNNEMSPEDYNKWREGRMQGRYSTYLDRVLDDLDDVSRGLVELHLRTSRLEDRPMSPIVGSDDEFGNVNLDVRNLIKLRRFLSQEEGTQDEISNNLLLLDKAISQKDPYEIGGTIRNDEAGTKLMKEIIPRYHREQDRRLEEAVSTGIGLAQNEVLKNIVDFEEEPEERRGVGVGAEEPEGTIVPRRRAVERRGVGVGAEEPEGTIVPRRRAVEREPIFSVSDVYKELFRVPAFLSVLSATPKGKKFDLLKSALAQYSITRGGTRVGRKRKLALPAGDEVTLVVPKMAIASGEGAAASIPPDSRVELGGIEITEHVLPLGSSLAPAVSPESSGRPLSEGSSLAPAVSPESSGRPLSERSSRVWSPVDGRFPGMTADQYMRWESSGLQEPSRFNPSLGELSQEWLQEAGFRREGSGKWSRPTTAPEGARVGEGVSFGPGEYPWAEAEEEEYSLFLPRHERLRRRLASQYVEGEESYDFFAKVLTPHLVKNPRLGG